MDDTTLSGVATLAVGGEEAVDVVMRQEGRASGRTVEAGLAIGHVDGGEGGVGQRLLDGTEGE